MEIWMIHNATLPSDQITFILSDVKYLWNIQEKNAKEEIILVHGQAAKVLGSNMNM